jgi:hypothetical protein
VLPEPYSALLDTSTFALLTLTQRIPIISFLAQTPIEGEHFYAVNYPNYLKKFEIADANYSSFPGWTWNLKERLFIPTPKHLLTDRLRKASLLAVKKSHVLFEIMRTLSWSRNPVLSGIPMQETVYITKKIQAQRYKDSNYPNEPFHFPYVAQNFPYVVQYSELSGLTMQQAADEILLKASFDDELLLKSEYFRLKYYDQLRKVTEIALIDPILINFREEFYRNIMI